MTAAPNDAEDTPVRRSILRNLSNTGYTVNIFFPTFSRLFPQSYLTIAINDALSIKNEEYEEEITSHVQPFANLFFGLIEFIVSFHIEIVFSPKAK